MCAHIIMLAQLLSLMHMILAVTVNSTFTSISQQFQLPKNKTPAYKQLYEGCTEPVYNLEGPHCDIWSFGCTLVQFCIGALILEDKLDVSVCVCVCKSIKTSNTAAQLLILSLRSPSPGVLSPSITSVHGHHSSH